jgi:hypothetical protein
MIGGRKKTPVRRAFGQTFSHTTLFVDGASILVFD